MIEEPQILLTLERCAAKIALQVSQSDVRQVMGPGLREVMAALAEQGVRPAGHWCTHHLRRPAAEWDFEICVPVPRAITPVGRVVNGSWPAIQVARTVYHGAYEGLGQAWGEFSAWIYAQGLAPREDLWECYAVGPESTDDAAQWRTELVKPLLA